MAWQGKLAIAYGIRDGQTKVVSNFSHAPLRVQRSFHPEEFCHSVILHTAGGIVGGDQLDINMRLEPHTKVLTTTATAAKVYGSLTRACQAVKIALATGAYLEWLPQETIIFNGARYEQSLYVDLEPDALWLGWEITRFGRTARGEKFVDGSWRSHTEVWRQDKPLWIDRQQLFGDNLGSNFSSYNGLHGCPVVGNLILVGKCLDQDLYREILQLVQGFTPQNQGEISISHLLEGMICRYRGHSSLEVREWFSQIWQHLRHSLIDGSNHKSVAIPRVWMNL